MVHPEGKIGTRQVECDPLIGGLVCFGKVGLKMYKEAMERLFRGRRGTKRFF